MKLLITFLVVFLPFAVFGKAAYHNKEQAIWGAEIIAIVNILKVEPAGKKTKGWTYSEVASAKVEQVLKGELPANVKLYGSEDFICAQVNYKPGKHLVFLQRDKDLLTGANWHLGVLPIKGDSVQWFESDTSIQLKPDLLNTVLEEIESVMQDNWPVLVHLRRGGRDPRPILKFAYWQDGTVLLRGEDDALRVGTIEHPEFWKMWSALREAKFFSMQRNGNIVFDVGYETIMAHWGNESARRNWHWLKPRTPETANKSPEYLEFVEMWKKSEAAIKELTPDNLRPLSEVAENGTFRGYVVDNPNHTEWLNNTQWKRRTQEK